MAVDCLVGVGKIARARMEKTLFWLFSERSGVSGFLNRSWGGKGAICLYLALHLLGFMLLGSMTRFRESQDG